MADIIARVRTNIFDPSGSGAFFTDVQIQDTLDEGREEIRYENLQLGASIVNTASTGNQAQTIFADYYSKFGWWESDAVLQGYSAGAPWIVLTPVTSDYITGHFSFESNVFTAGTVPGQLPPVFITGKVYDLDLASADLLTLWGAGLAGKYDITVAGQSLRMSQLMTAKLTLSDYFRRKARPRKMKMVRSDLEPALNTVRMRLLEGSVEEGR